MAASLNANSSAVEYRSPPRGASKTSRWSLTNPGSSAVRAEKLRTRSPVPTNSTTANPTSATTIRLASTDESGHQPTPGPLASGNRPGLTWPRYGREETE